MVHAGIESTREYPHFVPRSGDARIVAEAFAIRSVPRQGQRMPRDDAGRRYGPDVQSGDVIVEIGARLTAAVPPRTRVLLFGSRARDEAVDGSDFDILVIEPEVADAAKESVRLRRELRGLGVPIDIVVVDEVTAARRRAVRGTMVERALREGRLLVDA